MKQINSLLYTICCVCTAMIGYQIHHSIFWSIIDFFFAPIAWIWWLWQHEVNVSLIRETFSFFLK